MLYEAQENGENIYDVEMSKAQITRLLTAYGFLKLKRPDALSLPPDQFLASARAVAYLPRIYGRLPVETRDRDIQEYIEKVLRGQLTGTHLETLSMRVAGNKQGLNIGMSIMDRKISTTTVEEDEITIMGKALDHFDDMLNYFIKKHGYEKIRRHYSRQFWDMSVKCNCISDAQYQKNWETRKESVL
ncbi:MAG: hypothetical protein IMZ70_07145 [Candidatus Atribacteria bacterium]|nr:hypothetical protein [Candidatus Atribacteria bacterium]